MIAAAIESTRPSQWVKNLFNLFAASTLVFARLVGDAHAAPRMV